MPYLSLTSWSLHRNLGPLRWTRWDDKSKQHVTDAEDQPQIHTLLELPGILAERGFQALEICHFHFPDRGAAYIEKLRAAVQRSGVRFYTLLADYGDISNADDIRRQADIDWLKGWIDTAAAVGAERVRVIGGDADPADDQALQRAVQALQELMDYAKDKGVRIVTENFHDLTSTAVNCRALLDTCGSALGLTSDFGNFKGPKKYDELASTIPCSESIHAKAQTDASGNPDEAEFKRCMDIVGQAGYEGPITIVYDGPNDMWEGIERVQALVTPYL